MDTFSAAERSNIMRRVKSRNTRPERIVGLMVRSFGYRQHRNREDLPGCPDIVLPGKRIAIFVHGCFWHGHHCARGRLPTSNIEFWTTKISMNISRDRAARTALRRLGFTVKTLWACSLNSSLSRLIRELQRVRRNRRRVRRRSTEFAKYRE